MSEQQLSLASDLPDVPIGTIVLYSGDCSNSSVIGRLARNGWIPCDGSLLQVDEYPELYAVLGISHGGEMEDGVIIRFNLPNLTGRFVRGVNDGAIDPVTNETVDPDVNQRMAANRLGNTADKVGSIQYHATGRPTTPFSTDAKGAHNHSASHLTGDDHRALDGVSFYQARNTGESSTIDKTGLHQHVVASGGDEETRPTSLSLYYIIRFV